MIENEETNQLLDKNYLIIQYRNLNLSDLKEICINGKNIKSIDLNAFEGLNNLEFLNLSKNKIEELNETTFRNLSNLQKLDLSHNKLKKIDDSAFERLVNLMELDLSYNDIEEINVNCFRYLIKLTELNLKRNKLKIINADIFKGFQNLEDLNLKKNITSYNEDLEHSKNEAILLFSNSFNKTADYLEKTFFENDGDENNNKTIFSKLFSQNFSLKTLKLFS